MKLYDTIIEQLDDKTKTFDKAIEAKQYAKGRSLYYIPKTLPLDDFTILRRVKTDVSQRIDKIVDVLFKNNTPLSKNVIEDIFETIWNFTTYNGIDFKKAVSNLVKDKYDKDISKSILQALDEFKSYEWNV